RARRVGLVLPRLLAVRVGQVVELEQALARGERVPELTDPVRADRVFEQEPPAIDPGSYEQRVLGDGQRLQALRDPGELVGSAVLVAKTQAAGELVDGLEPLRTRFPGRH